MAFYYIINEILSHKKYPVANENNFGTWALYFMVLK